MCSSTDSCANVLVYFELFISGEFREFFFAKAYEQIIVSTHRIQVTLDALLVMAKVVACFHFAVLELEH